MKPRLLQLWAERRAVVVSVVLLSCAGVVGAVRLSSRVPDIPTAEVKRGEFIDSLQFRGEIKALKSISIAVPADAGQLQIVKLAGDGAAVKTGDAIVEFDRSKTEQELAQSKSALKAAQAEIEQVRAQGRLTEEANLTAVSKARFEVETARLEVSKQEIVSHIEGEEARLKLADAQQKQKEAEEKQKADHRASQATIQSKIQASQKALFDARRAERTLSQMTLRAPAAGLVSLVQRWSPTGQAVYKAGDQVYAGTPIAELPDTSTFRVSARVDEAQRGRLQPGQPITVQLDAIPDRQFSGHIDSISTIASTDFSGGFPFPRNFNLVALLDQNDSRIRPGMTVQLTVVIDRIPDVITIPVQAAFQHSGLTVAYVLKRGKFEERPVEGGKRNGDRILISRGLQSGERVALKDPTFTRE
jgi:HlyD family secretion protein